MMNFIIRKPRLDGMGDVIREKTNKTTLFYPLEMIEEVRKMGMGGGYNFIGSVSGELVPPPEAVIFSGFGVSFTSSIFGELASTPNGEISNSFTVSMNADADGENPFVYEVLFNADMGRITMSANASGELTT